MGDRLGTPGVVGFFAAFTHLSLAHSSPIFSLPLKTGLALSKKIPSKRRVKYYSQDSTHVLFSKEAQIIDGLFILSYFFVPLRHSVLSLAPLWATFFGTHCCRLFEAAKLKILYGSLLAVLHCAGVYLPSEI